MSTYKFYHSSSYNPPEQDKKKKSESLYINKNVNGYDLTFSVNQEGKVSLLAHKPLGSIAKAATAGDNEAHISINLETTEKRVPAFQLIDSNTRFNPQFVEVDDGLDRTTKTFNDARFYRREYVASSILTTDEFFSEIIPSFEALLKDTKLDGYVSKISDETSRVQKPFNKEYRQVK